MKVDDISNPEEGQDTPHNANYKTLQTVTEASLLPPSGKTML